MAAHDKSIWPRDAQLPMQLFVRDDDIGPLNKTLRTFVETFAAAKLPVSYQIIPAQLTPDCADYLRAKRSEYPDLIEFGQHGLHHAMTLGGRRLKREFGPERSAIQQLTDIREGLRLLNAGLGEEITLFTPPQHKFDRHTIEAAVSAGHQTFSAAAYPNWRHRTAYWLGRKLGLSSFRHHGVSHHDRWRPEGEIYELSIAIAVDDGRSIKCDPASLRAALVRAARVSPNIGLMFHHDVYEGEEGRCRLSALVDCLTAYGPFFKLGELARIRRSERAPVD